MYCLFYAGADIFGRLWFVLSLGFERISEIYPACTLGFRAVPLVHPMLAVESRALLALLSQLLVLSAVATAALDAAIAAQAALAAVLRAAGLVVHAQVLARRLVPVALAAVSLARACALARDVGRIQAKGIRPAGDAVVELAWRGLAVLALVPTLCLRDFALVLPGLLGDAMRRREAEQSAHSIARIPLADVERGRAHVPLSQLLIFDFLDLGLRTVESLPLDYRDGVGDVDCARTAHRCRCTR